MAILVFLFCLILEISKIEKSVTSTRMHSSRIRFVRLSGLPRGVCQRVSARGVSARGSVKGGMAARHLPMDRMTDTCKNITLPQLRFGR